jgi:hypothetical protein
MGTVADVSKPQAESRHQRENDATGSTTAILPLSASPQSRQAEDAHRKPVGFQLYTMTVDDRSITNDTGRLLVDHV